MKIIVLLNLLLAAVALSEDRLIIGFGKRQVDDRLLFTTMSKSNVLIEARTIRLTFNYDLGERYWTLLWFTTALEESVDFRWNMTMSSPGNQHQISAVFDVASDLPEFQIDLKVYGYLYSPGPIYP